MTQHALVIAYIKQYGSIVPAKHYGEVYLGVMFGSELSNRARELRKKGILHSEKDGKFERYFLKENVKINADAPKAIKYKELQKDPEFQALKKRLARQINTNPTPLPPAFPPKVEADSQKKLF